MRKLFRLFSLVVLASLVLAACGGGAPATQQPAGTQPPAATEPPATEPPAVTEPPAATEPPATGGDTPVAPPVAGGERLQAVLDRGQVICGVHGTFQGFGFVESDGSWTGFDVDFCRAWAAALFDDPNAVEFRGLSAQERFTALQSGEVDVLARNSTWTWARDVELGLTFGPVNFYDGQAIMAKREIVDDPAAGLEALEGANVCVQSGTTTELNLADQFRAAGVNYTPVVFEDQNAAFQAYDEGRCDAITSDRSQLATQGQAVLQNFADHVILDVVMSKEPLAPAVSDGDPQWAEVVQWVVYGMIQAEELGITSENVDTFLTSEDPVVRRLLGVEGELGTMLGLSNDFVYRVIKHVGNYGEVYDRNLSTFNLARGQNELWTNGGLMYSPPFR
ncbi:MAG TPA: transporter substrate-binding domain-containing protein [Candidatus Binatia bacterium]|nr:transporter substrate-binding domain-containing protein [Candidatus Binatia bacterium]